MITLSHNPELIRLTSTLGIHVYGVFVALGLGVLIACTHNHATRKKYLSAQRYDTLLIGSLIAGIIGARFVHVLSEWRNYDTFWQASAVWSGGLSILGAVLGAMLFSVYYLRAHKIPVLPTWDMGALYLPLAHAIARLGCFFTGCCHGPLAVPGTAALVYTHVNSSAPLCTPLVPVQLYSVAWYLVLWVIVLLAQRRLRAPGQLALLYVIGSCAERFFLDFLRGDRIIDTPASFINFHYFSMHQWISLLMMMGAGTVLYVLARRK